MVPRSPVVLNALTAQDFVARLQTQALALSLSGAAAAEQVAGAPLAPMPHWKQIEMYVSVVCSNSVEEG